MVAGRRRIFIGASSDSLRTTPTDPVRIGPMSISFLEFPQSVPAHAASYGSIRSPIYLPIVRKRSYSPPFYGGLSSVVAGAAAIPAGADLEYCKPSSMHVAEYGPTASAMPLHYRPLVVYTTAQAPSALITSFVCLYI